MTRACFAWWSPEALAVSLHLAFLTGLVDAGNDNGSRLSDRTPATSGLPVGGRDEHVANDDTEHGGELAEQGQRQVHPALDALDRREVNVHPLRQLSLAPLLPDPKLPRP